MVKTPPNKRGPTSNKYALELHGRHCGWLTDVAGALTVGELGSAGRVGRYEELTLRCWPGMPHEFYAWVARSLTGELTPAHGGVILADDDNAEMSRLSFEGGVITELAVTRYEYGFGENLKIQLKFSPQSSRRSYTHGFIGPEAAETRRPLPPTDPELHIDGLEEACSQVRRIEGLSIRQRIERAPASSGGGVYRLGPPTVGRFSVVLAESKALGFVRWLEACERGRSNGRAASLTLGAPAVGFTVVLPQVRPARLVVEEGEAAGEGRRREVRVELEARGVEFAFAPARETVV